MNELRRWLTPMVLLLLVLAAVETYLRLAAVPSYIFPQPSAVFSELFRSFPGLAGHALTTVVETVAGLAIGVCAGVVLALLIVVSRTVERALYPLIIATQMVPVFAIAPLLVVWFGYGIWSKAATAALLVFFPVTVGMVDGLRSPTEDQRDLLRSLQASRRQTLRLLELPASVPALFSGLKVGVTLGVVGATIGEWIGAQRGLGFVMVQANALLRLERVFAAIVLLTAVGLLLFGLVRIIEKKVLARRG
ncbi:ABC transporter permease [Candidatus Bipolaricaulota bacterium]|nr:ABC transporter permease [Candidatus Bipolaricaulota bacterium]